MKQKDIALIVAIVVLSAIISLFVSKAVFSSPKKRQQQVEVVEPITSDFAQPDSKYFNDKSFDPTQQVNIGQGNNPDPFSGQSQ